MNAMDPVMTKHVIQKATPRVPAARHRPTVTNVNANQDGQEMGYSAKVSSVFIGYCLRRWYSITYFKGVLYKSISQV